MPNTPGRSKPGHALLALLVAAPAVLVTAGAAGVATAYTTTAPTTVSPAGYVYGATDMGPDGTVVVVSQGSGSPQFATRRPGGTWSAPAAASDKSTLLAASAAPDGSVWLVMNHVETSPSISYGIDVKQLDPAGSLGAATPLITPTTNMVTNVDVDTNARGDVFVTWLEYTSPTYRLRAAIRPAGTGLWTVRQFATDLDFSGLGTSPAPKALLNDKGQALAAIWDKTGVRTWLYGPTSGTWTAGSLPVPQISGLWVQFSNSRDTTMVITRFGKKALLRYAAAGHAVLETQQQLYHVGISDGRGRTALVAGVVSTRSGYEVRLFSASPGVGSWASRTVASTTQNDIHYVDVDQNARGEGLVSYQYADTNVGLRYLDTRARPLNEQKILVPSGSAACACMTDIGDTADGVFVYQPDLGTDHLVAQGIDRSPRVTMGPLGRWTFTSTVPLTWDVDPGVWADPDTTSIWRTSSTPTKTWTPLAVWQSFPAATTAAAYPATPGRTYCFSGQGHSSLGGTGPLSAKVCTTAPLDDRDLSKTTGWTNVATPAAYLGTERKSTFQGATLSYSVKTTRLALVATTCPTCGSVEVSLHGKLLKKVSLKSAVTRHRQVIPVKSWSALKSGTVQVSVTTGGKPVYVDGLGTSRL